MLVIRLARFGKKKKPFYRIVVAESKAAVSGKYIEKIGHYNPLLNPPDIFVDQEKTKKWIKNGAKPSNTVWNLLVVAGILKKKIVTQRKKTKKEKRGETKMPTKPEKAEETKPPQPPQEENTGQNTSRNGRAASQEG